MNTGQVILSYVLASMSVFCFATGIAVLIGKDRK
jgi:hypothetical protein|nr:MAG TPA: hypothetical protein [Caudoviricetes sp.]